MHLIRAAGAVCLAVVLIAGCRLNEDQQQAEGENTAVTQLKSVLLFECVFFFKRQRVNAKRKQVAECIREIVKRHPRDVKVKL